MRIGLPIPDYIGIGKGGGIETYSMKLVECLQKIDTSNDYLIFCTSQNENMFPLRSRRFKKALPESERTKDKERSIRKVLESAILGVSAVMEKNVLSRRIKNRMRDFVLKRYSFDTDNNHECDLVHHMYTVFPFWINYNVPVILTMHDIQQEYFPQFFTEKELEERKACFKPSADKADHIIAISGYTKKTLMEKYDIDDSKISVVYNGYDQESFKTLDNSSIQKIRTRYHLPDSFLFYPAASWPHKNHVNLVRAYNILKGKYDFRDKLILCGIEMQHHGVIEKEIDKLNLKNDVIYLGYVPYDDLPGIFNAATLMVYPSYFEGFGIPIIEAMATGLPVVCSGTSSLPEVAGEAALFFKPDQPEDIAERINRAYTNSTLRNELVRKGLEQVKQFTWENTANATLTVYNKIHKTYYKS